MQFSIAGPQINIDDPSPNNRSATNAANCSSGVGLGGSSSSGGGVVRKGQHQQSAAGGGMGSGVPANGELKSGARICTLYSPGPLLLCSVCCLLPVVHSA